MLSPGPKDRFAPMVRDTECLRGKLSGPKSRDGSNKILHKKFIGGQLTLVGSNAPSGLAMRPIRILLCDEVDRYPASAGAEGDPVNLARKRTVTFWNRKIILVSTPTIKGASRIDAAWENSDKRRYWVPCPDCGEHQVLRWEQVRWDKSGKGKTSRHLPETAHYVCEHCGGTWSDPRRWAAVRHGEWRAEKPFVDTAGFHLNEIYSPWKKLEEMVREFLSAREMGEEAVKVFVNTSLGEVFEIRGEAPEWERIYNRREDYPIGTVPDGGLFLTAGADVQRDRIEGGAVMPLYPGDKMSSFSPNRPSDKFAPFVDAMNRHVAASLNMPYELLLKDFSKTNYSSARAALLEA
ncbi:MAG TPA: phage portal protein, partial [Rhodospirillales bacterium]|nr:phage portal protein [Rhodospirillales bacterium]